MFQILEIAEIKVGKKTSYCLNLSLVFPIIWILIHFFSGYNLKNAGRKQKFGYAKKFAIWAGNFDFKKSNVSREKRGYQNSPET